MSMGQIQAVGTQADHTEKATSSVCVSDANGGGGTVVTIQPAPTAKRRLEYRTEYKKSFRPFSNYEYVGGRFVPAHHGHAASLASVHQGAASSSAGATAAALAP